MKLNKIKLSNEPLTLNEVDGDRINESFKAILNTIEQSIDINLFDDITKDMTVSESFQLLQTYFFTEIKQLEIPVNPVEYEYLLHWIEDLFDYIKQ